MAIANKFIWATDPKTDPVSGQPNKNPSIDARLEQYGWDFNEKPLRQDLNLSLNKIGTNIEDIDSELDSINSSLFTNAYIPSAVTGVLGKDKSNPSRIDFNFTVNSALISATAREFTVTAGVGKIKQLAFGGGIKLDANQLFGDAPVGNVYGLIPSETPGSLAAGEYIVCGLWRESDDTINYIITDTITTPLGIPAFVKALGYTYIAPLFPVVWTGTNLQKFYASNDRIFYYDADNTALVTGLSTAANTLYELDFTTTGGELLVPIVGETASQTRTVRAKISLEIDGANSNDFIVGATGSDQFNTTPATPITDMAELRRIGNPISPDTTVHIFDEFETRESKMYYYSTAVSTVTITGKVHSYINPFSRYFV